MSTNLAYSLLALATYLLLTSCQPKPRPLTIAAAASLRYVAEAAIAEYEQQTGERCELVVGSTGKLTAQILAGAPYDILLSADEKYPRQLAKANKTIGPIQTFGRSGLVLWTMDTLAPLSLDSLGPNDRIAIANPATAPFGQLADSLLRLRPDFLTSVEARLVYGESIAQVNQFVTTGAVKYGLTAEEVIRAENLAHHGNWKRFGIATIPQTAVLLNDTVRAEARIFLALLD